MRASSFLSSFEPCCGGAVTSRVSSSSCRSRRDFSSHLRDVPDQVTVIRKRHVFEGQTLAVISRIKRRGVLLVVVILPNGSRSLIPAAWTDWRDADASPSVEDIEDTSSLGKLGDLLQLRTVIGDSLTNTRFSD